MAHQIEKVSWRARAKPRRAPYWKLNSSGRYLGWRKMTSSGPGKWWARAWDAESRSYPAKPLGDFGDLPDEKRYDAALAEAVKWWSDRDMGVPAKSASVKAACEAYVANQRIEKSDGNANDATGRFERLVYTDPIARVELSKLTPRHLAEWKQRVLEKGGARISYNRNAAPFKAALNFAYRRREVASDFAWREELKPFKNAANRRTLYLDAAERRSLIENASAEARPFFQVLNMLPMRPGEVASLLVKHLKASERVLEIPVGKTEPRKIPLTDAALAHFKESAKGKTPEAWLVSRADRSQWRKEVWRDEVKLAAAGAKLPHAVVAYTLRHSVITDLVTGGLDIFHVAKLAGTSVGMIEAHYGHAQGDHARAALEKMAAA